eukprot:8126389-Alexandrium_andersonii.AAC.1
MLRSMLPASPALRSSRCPGAVGSLLCRAVAGQSPLTSAAPPACGTSSGMLGAIRPLGGSR